MIILDILNPENDEVEALKKIEKKEITIEEIQRKLPQVSLQIISIDGKIIAQ